VRPVQVYLDLEGRPERAREAAEHLRPDDEIRADTVGHIRSLVAALDQA
jgi:hypothetical protein